MHSELCSFSCIRVGVVFQGFRRSELTWSPFRSIAGSSNQDCGDWRFPGFLDWGALLYITKQVRISRTPGRGCVGDIGRRRRGHWAQVWILNRLSGGDSLCPQARKVCTTYLPSISPEACEHQKGEGWCLQLNGEPLVGTPWLPTERPEEGSNEPTNLC